MISARFKVTSLTLTLAAVSAFGALTGCAGQGDIDRTQPDKVLKANLFNADGSPKIFYFRQTYVGVPPTSGWAFEGTQGSMEKVYFEIDEKFLKAFRAYDYAPGADNAFTGGANNTDSPLMIYAITSHFDVKREYNAGTGEQTNVISENTTDRPWDQRDYMRVDWSADLAQPVAGGGPYDPMTQFMPVQDIHATSYVQEMSMSNPQFANQPIMTADYMDFVQERTQSPDYQSCLLLYPGVDDGGPWDCGPAQLSIRNSFMAVKPSSYEPMDYPDNYNINDASGNAIQVLPNGYPCTADTFNLAGGTYSGADCAPATTGAFSKFGFFRTIVQTYNRNYAETEDGREYFINRWNIWDNVDKSGNSVFNKDGSLRTVALNDRKIKPIVYYTNIEFPNDMELFTQATAVTADWSGALKQTVAAMYASAAQPNSVISPTTLTTMAKNVPEMVVLKQNSCNLTSLQPGVPTVTTILQDPVNATIADSVVTNVGLDVKSIDLAHLAQTCSIMEALGAKVTQADGTTVPFAWQRNGDLRYSFFYWVDRPEPTMPLGYGPASADPQTGEIISASLYNYGAALDSYAQTSADAVELINGQISVDDLLSGKTIADVLAQTAATSKARNTQTLTPEAKALATTLLRRGGAAGSAKLIPVPGGTSLSRMSLIKGTPVEQAMMTEDILAAKLPLAKPGDVLTSDQFAQASPVTWLDPTAHDQTAQARQTLAMNGCVYLGEFADDAILGLALTMKQQHPNYTNAQIQQAIRVLIFRGLADHEMGHTMGLRHNFEGSADALNYNDQFWALHENKGLTDDQRNQQSMSEYRYSTVMDYGSRFNSDVRGLGKYDYAAIRFGYGQFVDVMPPGALNETGAQLQNDIFIDDYTRLPGLVNGVENLEDGGVLPYSTIRANLQTAYEQEATSKNPQGGTFVTTERPYMFCSDEYIGNLTCKQWDWGANQQEIVSDTIDRFHNYFVFNAFKRGRLNWSIDGYLNRLLERYFERYTEAYQFYYFYGDLLADTDLAGDLLKASMDSLNALGEVLETPEPGEHCPTQENPSLLVLPTDPSGADSCMSGQASMDIEIPDGKPYFINFSNDYYYRITRAGSLYEKLGALITLTSTQAHFYRVDTFADANEYAVNFYSIFKDQMLNLLSGVIRNDPSTYGGYVPTTGPNPGTYQPTPVVDLTTFGQAKPTLPAYMQPGVKRVDTPVNKTIQYYALGLTLANLNTSWDSTLDVANYLAVSAKGAKDDQDYGPGTPVIEYTHPQSGVTYRAPVLNGDTYSGIASRTLQELIDITGTVNVPGTIALSYGFDPNAAVQPAPLPDWQTAKAAMDAAQAAAAAGAANDGKLQTSYTNAVAVFQAVDFLVSYRVDLLSDIRNFRAAFGY